MCLYSAYGALDTLSPYIYYELLMVAIAICRDICTCMHRYLSCPIFQSQAIAMPTNNSLADWYRGSDGVYNGALLASTIKTIAISTE